VLGGFKDDRVNYNDFMVYFDARDSTKPKTDDNTTRAREKWIVKYTEVLNKYGLDANNLLKEADKNKDGKLELTELQNVIKIYIKNKDLTYSDLRNIMDALDANNDGTVSTKEYQSVILEYGSKQKSPPATQEDEKDGKL
jgi:hypothetical protein